MGTFSARSRSDAELADWVSRETGIPISGWQIERWRQAGLLQPPTYVYPGRGSKAIYSEEARHQTAELARLSLQYHDHYEIARVLFARDLYVRGDALRAVLTKVVDEAETWIGPANSEMDLNRIDSRAQKLFQYARRTKAGQRLQRRLRGRGVKASAMAAGVYYNLLHLLKTGIPSSEEGFSELLEGFGLLGLTRDQIDGAGPIAPHGEADLGTFLREANLAKVRELLTASSIDDLRASRDMIRLCFPLLKDFAVLATTWFRLPDAFGFGWLADLDLDDLQVGTWVPFGLVLLPYTKTDEAQDLLAKLAQSADHFHQMAILAKSLPSDVVAAMRRGDPDPLIGLPADEREKFVKSAASVLIAGAHSPFLTDQAALPTPDVLQSTAELEGRDSDPT